jgi:hypothetical protein
MRVGSVPQNSRDRPVRARPSRSRFPRLSLVLASEARDSGGGRGHGERSSRAAGGARPPASGRAHARPVEELATGVGARDRRQSSRPSHVRAAAADFASKSSWLVELAMALWGRAVLAAAPWGARCLASLAAQGSSRPAGAHGPTSLMLRGSSRPAPELGWSGPPNLGRRGEEGPSGAHAGDRI